MMAAVDAEVERRVAEKQMKLDEERAHLAREMLLMAGKREELDRLLDKLTARVAGSDTDSVASAPSAPTSAAATAFFTPRGAPSFQLDFIFNKLRPRTQGVLWPVLRAAYNMEPGRFEMAAAHVSAGDPTPHYTIYYKCPVHKHDGTIGEYVVKLHVHYTEVAGKHKFSSVSAQTLAGSMVPQEIANFT